MEIARRSVAVVGASADRNKFGNRAVRAYHRQGWTVYPVNPRGGEIEGLPVYRSLDELPEPPDRVALYLPPEVGLQVLPEIAMANPAELFINPGADSAELLEHASAMGLNVIFACAIVDIGESPEAL
ncbi:MAG: CoA-binding protein [Phycisphaerales bacterium]|nr:CoA-binding protein [Phycisphaerales bacterium]